MACGAEESTGGTRKAQQFSKSAALQKRLFELVPGGGHTYAKGADQYPEHAAPIISHGKGCHVWDVDGNEFIEYGSGLRAVALGHAYAPVVKAVYEQMLNGNNFVRPAALEVECAEMLLSFFPNADMVKFGKNGSDATSAAVKLARAYTGRSMVGLCAEHPFFSVDDWFIGTTQMNAGIPAEIRALTTTFHYNDLESIREMFNKYPGKIACIIMEGEKDVPPKPGFFDGVRTLCDQYGVVFILDEMITGFRWHNSGAQGYHGIKPDLTALGKAMGNGFSAAALAGKREIMCLGGADHDRERVFLLSLTHGAEGTSLAAALATMNVYKNEPVVATMWKQGERLRSGVNAVIAKHQLQGYVEVIGRPCCLVYATRDQEKKPSQPFRTLFLQEIIKRGILAPSFILGYSHSDEDIDRTVEAVDGALCVYRKAIEDGVEKYLEGRSVQPVMRKFH